SVVKSLKPDLDYLTCCYILDNLNKHGIITNNEEDIIKSAISPKALSSPFKTENVTRYNIFKNILINLKNRGN
ncbi:MAG: hypothetical protein ACI4TI_03865, partial [Christensenellales bacterium]